MSPPAEQAIRFCSTSDGFRIAFAASGDGPPLVKAANWLSHLEFDWNSPVWRPWLRELSRDHRLVRYDERGCGLSDRTVEEFSLDAWVRDLEAVVDALELERFPLLGISQGGPIAIAYAARHPERVSRLILYGSYPCGRAHRQLSDRERVEREVMIRMIEVGWGKDHSAFRQVFTSLFLPDATPEQTRWFNELQRVSTSPENASRMVRTFDHLDVRALAPRLTLMTLVLHAKGDLRVPFEAGRQLASLIPGSRFVPLEGRNHILLESEPAWHRFLAEVRSFLGVPAEAPAPSGTRRRRIEALLDEALDLAVGDRAELLARECRGDPELRREVESLLAAAERSGVTAHLAGRLVGPAAGPAVPIPAVAQYEVMERIGGGGMGVVYRALDRRLQRHVALKFLPPVLSDDAELKRRFLQEATAIAALDHPNVCTIFEVAEPEAGRLVIVMPYYDGETLKAKIARGPLPPAQAIDYALQIVAGLAHAHAAGVVHRDIKPANVIVTPDERVKILDFGVAKVAAAKGGLTRTGAVLGTLAYMSPEQACGDPIDHRTDLWAVGAVLYEMVAGRQPFAADSMEALFYAIQWRDPAPLSALRPQVSPALEALIHRLLEKDPARRCQDARALLGELERLRAEVSAAPAELRPEAERSRSQAPLVGRSAELARLSDLFRAACRGERRLVFVAGEPGIGKSSLVDLFLRRVGGRGPVRSARGGCLDQRGAGEPYLPCLEAIGRLCRGPEGGEVIAALERYAPTWLAQMPSLLEGERLEAVQRRAFAATRGRMLREMLEFLDAITVERPLLLLLEDLHWSDPSTLDLLTAIARRPEPAQLLVLGTYRPGDASEDLVRLTRTLVAEGLAAELALEVWTEPEARAYLAARCAPGALSSDVADLLLRRTGGHPLFMRSLLDDWQERAALVRDGGDRGPEADLGLLARTVPASLRASIEQRLDGLPPADREVLEAASVAGSDFEAATVAAALGLEEEAVEATLARLTRPGWVIAQGTTEWADGTLTARYGFGHHLHQELLYARLPLSRRIRLHERIGRRLEAAHREHPAARATVLALHFSIARDDARAVRYLKHAAEQAVGRSAYREAVGHLEAALEILRRRSDLPDASRTELELQRLLGPALLVTRGWGDPLAERAYDRARALSELLDDSRQLGKVLYGLAYLHEIRGDYSRSQSLIEERLRLSLMAEDPAAVIESHELLSCSLLHQGSFDAALRHARVGLDLAAGGRPDAFVASLGEHAGVACLYWAALALWFLGKPDEAVVLALRAIESCGDAEHGYMLALAELQAARLFQHRREPARAAEHAERAFVIAERQGYPYQQEFARTLLGWADVMAGRIPAGLDRLRLGLEGQSALGAGMERPYSLGLLADALSHAGDPAAAEARIGEALALPELRERSFFWEAELRRLRGMLLLRGGRTGAAEASLRQAVRSAAGQGARSLELRAAVALCELHRTTGVAPDAPEHLREVLGGFTEGFDAPDLREARATLEAESAPAP